MKTKKKWKKKIRAQPLGTKKNSCTAQRRKKKILTKQKLPNPPLKNKMVHPLVQSSGMKTAQRLCKND